jgi:hypothetical protein
MVEFENSMTILHHDRILIGLLFGFVAVSAILQTWICRWDDRFRPMCHHLWLSIIAQTTFQLWRVRVRGKLAESDELNDLVASPRRAIILVLTAPMIEECAFRVGLPRLLEAEFA